MLANKTQGRKKSVSKDPLRMVQRILILGLMLCGTLLIGFGVQKSWVYLTSADYFRIRKITFSGYTLLNESSLRPWLEIQEGENILRVDLNRLADRLQAHPWVKRVRAWRLLPQEIFIEIEERSPFAVIDTGKTYVIDAEGYVLQEIPPAQSYPFLEIQGLSKRVYQVGEQVRDPSLRLGMQILALIRHREIFRALQVTSIDISDPQRPWLVLGNDQLTIRIASEDLENKLHLLHRIAAYIPQRERDIEYLDLSFRNQIVVKPALITAVTSREP